MDNLDVTPTAPQQQGSNVDPIYQQAYGEGGDVAERQVGFPVVPRFTHYHLKPLKASPQRSDSGNCGARAMVEIVEGPEGTVGMKFTDSGNIGYGFMVAREYDKKDGTHVVLDDAAYQKKVKTRGDLFRRVRAVLGLKLAFPPGGGFSDPALAAYCAQFADGRSFIAEVRIEKGNDGVERNRIVWESVAALDEPEKDSNGKPTGKTALQFAREKIAAFGKPQKGGKSAGSLAPSDLR